MARPHALSRLEMVVRVVLPITTPSVYIRTLPLSPPARLTTLPSISMLRCEKVCAVAAGATLAAIFAFVTVSLIGVVLSAGGLAEPTPAFELVWQLHAAAFALALPALGATFIGAALATHASGLTRPWQRLLGVAGGSLLILAGAGNLAIADGSPLLFVGVTGLAAWLVWLVVTGLRLIRGQG
jgi:hypothetical protein